MVDKTPGKQRGPLINVSDPSDLDYWCQKFRCRPDELREAVRAVGHVAADVETFLNHLLRRPDT